MNKCYHCGLNIPIGSDYFIFINNEKHAMCCRGCLFVAKFIIDNNFGNYYLYRTDFNKTIFNDLNDMNHIYDDEVYQSKFVKRNKNISYVVLSINGITCAACTWLIEQYLKKINGISDIFVNLTTCKAHITWNASILKLSTILNEFNKIGYKASPYLYNEFENLYKLEYKKELKKLLVSGICMSQVMMLSASLYIGEGKDMHYLYWNFIRWINLFITTPVLFFAGFDIFFSAFKSLKLKFFGMDFTISLSLILAYFSSLFNLLSGSGDVYFDSICMFVFFLLIGRFLEMRARHHSNDILYSLQEIAFKSANLIKDTEIIKISVEKIRVGDILLIKQGDSSPVDCEIVNGSSNFDESMLTGESVPVYKEIGCNLAGGVVNLTNNVVVRAVKNHAESTISVIIKLLNDSIYVKPKLNVISDVVANFFVITVLFLTCFVSLFWVFFSNVNIFNVVLSMLVITCPCALSLAAPVAITNSINFLIKNGFLIVRSESLENMKYVTDIIFDKTGTITLNEFVLEKIKLNSNSNLGFVFSIASILEESSEHPISKAFYNSDFNKINIPYFMTDIRSYINNGVEGCVNGVCYRIGKKDFIKDWSKHYIDLDFNGFYIILADKLNVLAWFKLSNPLRQNIDKCIIEIKKLGIKTHVLSGDSLNNVNYISDYLKVDFRQSNASVNDKVNYVKKLQGNKSIVMMIGDGINDAPALSVADLSIAMGSGVDLAKINSDIILLNNDLFIISIAIKHCKKLSYIINQNFIWAIFYNISGLFLAGMNLISPYYAALGMSLSSLIVVINSMRLNRR